MKLDIILKHKSMVFAFIALLLSVQSMFAQDALTSVKFTINNFRLSTDQKVISYDVYLKDIDSKYIIAVPGFIFRLMVPLSDLGNNDKTVSVTNGTVELGAASATMTPVGSNWLMKFNQKSIALTYPATLKLSDVRDGTLVGTFNIANKDGSSFSSNQTFNAIYSGSGITKNSTVAILKPNTIKLAANSTTAQPESNTVGLGVYKLSTTGFDKMSNNYLTPFPNPATNRFNINVGQSLCELNIYNLKGEKLMTQQVSGTTSVDISTLTSGVYLVEVNGVQTKLVKK